MKVMILASFLATMSILAQDLVTVETDLSTLKSFNFDPPEQIKAGNEIFYPKQGMNTVFDGSGFWKLSRRSNIL